MTEPELDFNPSRGFSMGVELELQLVDAETFA